MLEIKNALIDGKTSKLYRYCKCDSERCPLCDLMVIRDMFDEKYGGSFEL